MMAVSVSERPGPVPTTGADEPRRRRWTVAEYERMAEVGLLGPEERVELIDGEIIQISPQNSPHATSVSLTYDALRSASGRGFYVRQQLPLRLSATVQPEPDLAVVSGSARDYRSAHPDAALLVVEISDTTLAFDRGVKTSLYASAGVADYWLLDLGASRLEVRRDPIPMASEPHGYGYRSVTLFQPGDRVSPLAAPRLRVAVADLLPERAEEDTP